MGTFAWELGLSLLRLGSFTRDLSFGIFRSGNSGLGGWGNRWAGDGGTEVLVVSCLVLRHRVRTLLGEPS